MKGGKMEKPIYQSKTLWGFGVAGLVALLQILGFIDQSIFTEALKVISGFFGVYGLRSALD